MRSMPTYLERARAAVQMTASDLSGEVIAPNRSTKYEISSHATPEPIAGMCVQCEAPVIPGRPWCQRHLADAIVLGKATP
jgi:hypothetical protein